MRLIQEFKVKFFEHDGQFFCLTEGKGLKTGRSLVSVGELIV